MQTNQKDNIRQEVPVTPGILIEKALRSLKAHPEINARVRVTGRLGKLTHYDSWSASSLLDKGGSSSIRLYFNSGLGNMPLCRELVEGKEYVIDGLLSVYVSGDTMRLQMAPLAVEGVVPMPDQPVEEPMANFLMQVVRTKMAQGYKDVYSIFDMAVKEHRMPRVGLVRPRTDTAQRDIVSGLGSYAHDFAIETRACDFTDAKAIAEELAEADRYGYDAILFSRGGGEALDVVDRQPVLEVLSVMKTPVIAGLGHEKDSMLAGLLVDRACSVPFDVGRCLGKIYAERIERDRLKAKLYKAELRQNGMDEKGKPLNESKSFYGLPGTSSDVARYIIMALAGIGIIQVLSFIF